MEILSIEVIFIDQKRITLQTESAFENSMSSYAQRVFCLEQEPRKIARMSGRDELSGIE